MRDGMFTTLEYSDADFGTILPEEKDWTSLPSVVHIDTNALSDEDRERLTQAGVSLMQKDVCNVLEPANSKHAADRLDADAAADDEEGGA